MDNPFTTNYSEYAAQVSSSQIKKQKSTQVNNLPSASATPLREEYHAIYTIGYTPSRDTNLPTQLVKMWPIFKETQAKQPKDSLELAGERHFSSDFSSLLGEENVTNVQGIDDEVLHVALYEALVEENALRQLRGRDNQYLERLLNIHEPGLSVTGSIGPDGKAGWYISPWNVKGTSLVELISRIFSVSRLDAIATLADIIGMDFGNIERLFSTKHAAEGKTFQSLEIVIPKFLPLTRLQTNAVLIDLVNIKGNAGQIIGAIAQYKCNGRTFCLPATVGRGTLAIGRYKATAFFLNQHLMDERPSAVIVLCQDIRTATAWQKLLNESRSTDDLNIIISGHLFDDLSILPWSYFHGHDVVFVPAPDKQCMAMTKAYHAYVMGAGAKSFRVARYILLHTKPARELNASDCFGLAGIEKELACRSVFLGDVERPIWIVKKILDTATSYEEFVQWGREAGIFKHPKQTTAVAKQGRNLGLQIFDMNIVPASTQPQHISEVTLSHILPAGIIMIHGFKNAGKSQAIFEMLRVSILGGKLFGLFSSDAPLKNSGILDTETPEALFRSRITQYNLEQEVGVNFFPYSKLQLVRSGEKNIVLTDEDFRFQIENEIFEKQLKLFIIDNLASVASPGGIYQQNIAGTILDWASSLAAKGIAVPIVHHSQKKSGKSPMRAAMRGSEEFTIRAHTEIVVIGKEQIIENTTPVPEEIKLAAAREGTVSGIYFKYCKMACVLEGHTFWFHLPLSDRAAWRLLAITGRDGESVDHSSVSPARSVELDAASSDYDGNESDARIAEVVPDAGRDEGSTANADLTDEERQVFQHACKLGRIQTKDVGALLGCKDTKARGILNSLVQKEKIQRVGDGAAMSYILID